jgi:hypothetical protein
MIEWIQALAKTSDPSSGDFISPQIAQGFARVVFDMLMQSSKVANNQ